MKALLRILEQLKYTYPYHQAIGFYLERAGYPAASLEPLRAWPMEFDFHLANKMGRTSYVKAWRLHVPKEL